SRRPPLSPLFPYTTLFRSRRMRRPPPRAASWRSTEARSRSADCDRALDVMPRPFFFIQEVGQGGQREVLCGGIEQKEENPGALRSEEHTSELQSRENLVCR